MREDLGKRKLCACLVPHSLTLEQREDQVTSFQNITVADPNKNFFNLIVMENLTWCFTYDPEIK
jgi:hypothetical protein